MGRTAFRTSLGLTTEERKSRTLGVPKLGMKAAKLRLGVEGEV